MDLSYVSNIPRPSKLRTLSQQRVWLSIFLLFTILGIINSIEAYGASFTGGQAHLPWRFAFLWGLLTWYLFLPFVPLARTMTRRFPLSGETPGRSFWIHIVSAPVIGIVHSLLLVVVFSLLTEFKNILAGAEGVLHYLRIRPYVLISQFLLGVLVYATMLAVSHAADYYRGYQEGRIRALRLETQLAQSRVQALKMQLHPHFLFNTLHSISALQFVNPASARKMTVLLGDFLRTTLKYSNEQEVSISEELEFLNCYLAIEQIRFGDRLQVNFNINPETLDARVPHLILQPIVENAIRHAIAPFQHPGTILISVSREYEWLKLKVVDSGPGLPKEGAAAGISGMGVGLSNTRARLKELYSGNHRLSLENSVQGGLAVIITIPFSSTESPAGDNIEEVENAV